MIEVPGVLQLRGLAVVRDSRLANVTSLSIVNTSLRIGDDTLEQLAQTMPRLETLDLSGSRIEHIHGIQTLCANGLKRLLVKGCRITDISALEDVAKQVHEGRWKGVLQLEEVDMRDNEVEKVSLMDLSGAQLTLHSWMPFLDVCRCGVFWWRTTHSECHIAEYGSERVSQICITYASRSLIVMVFDRYGWSATLAARGPVN